MSLLEGPAEPRTGDGIDSGRFYNICSCTQWGFVRLRIFVFVLDLHLFLLSLLSVSATAETQKRSWGVSL
jgi:hypothetical protein